MPYSPLYKYIPGDRKVDCDVCDFTWRFSQMRKGIAEGQKGLEVCPDCFDPIHPRENTPKLRKKSKLPEVK
jgi:hypothetical protein